MTCRTCGLATEVVKTVFAGGVRERTRTCEAGHAGVSIERWKSVTGKLPVANPQPTRNEISVAGNSSATNGGFRGDLFPVRESGLIPDPSRQSGSGRSARKSTVRANVEQELSPAFVAFWAVYPKKKSKGDAWKAWQQMGCEDLADRVMATLAWEVPEDFLRREPDKVPHPASWLRDSGWLDERSTPPVAVAPAKAPLRSIEDQIRINKQAEAERLLAQRKATVARDLETEQRARERMAAK